MNHFKTTKTIRFKLISHPSNALINKSVSNLTSEKSFDLGRFSSLLTEYISLIEKYFFYLKEGRLIVKDFLFIKKPWVSLYAKQQFIKLRDKDRMKCNRIQHTIKEYEITHIIEDSFNTIQNICVDLQKNASASLHSRARKAQTALLLKNLSTKDALPKIVSLVENTTQKKEQNNDSLQLKSLGFILLQQLETGNKVFLPEQATGIALAKATFNYYTINKKPIDYNEKKNRKEYELTENVLYGVLKTFFQRANISARLQQRLEKDIKERSHGLPIYLGETPFKDIKDYASLRQILKNIISFQKAEFNALVQSGTKYEDLISRDDLYLFTDISKDEFYNYCNLTDKIEDLATEKNQTKNQSQEKRLNSPISELKKKRGNLISATSRDTKDSYQSYKKIANVYRMIAQKHGHILASLKGIEKEKAESQFLNYWAMILQEKKQHKLVLIPRNKARSCKELLYAGQDTTDTKLYWFESFTFRSLQKLCFGNVETGSNTFYPAIKSELQYKFYTMDRNGNKNFITGEHEFKGNEQKKIEFYKAVLSTKYARNVLNIPFNEVKDKILNVIFDNLDDFSIALEKICYIRNISTNKNLINKLINDFDAQIFDITSLDIEHPTNVVLKETIYNHSDKSHTQIWKQFWSMDNENNNYDIRLNPEITIVYRMPKESRVIKYGVNSNNYDVSKKNRYLHEQFTLVTTISEHCNTPTRSLSFAAIDEIKETVNKFNTQFNKNNITFAFGIDNGEVELSTLGIYLPTFNKNTNEEKCSELKKVDHYGFKTLTITNKWYSEVDINGRERRLIQNPSYFLNEELYCRTFGKDKSQYMEMFYKVFEEKYLLSIDLSTAKLINGYIVTNGDLISLFNLWLRHAQRTIYEMNEHSNRGGARNITLKKAKDLSIEEKRKFIDILNYGNKKYKNLTQDEKTKYVKWVYDKWDKREDVQNPTFDEVYRKCRRKGNFLYGVLMAISHVDGQLKEVTDIFDIKNVFKFREDFECIMSENEILKELNKYNIRQMSNEELDMKLNQRKNSLVANVIGIIDSLYKQYRERFGGGGIIVKEGFDHIKIENDRKKFSGNIYRTLERKLYQKFQNYGLVPPIKNILELRGSDLNNTGSIMQIGNICFVDYSNTSQKCPICEKGHLEHDVKCSENCGFESEGIMHSNDGIASYNIAKKGFKMLNEYYHE